MLHTTAVQGGSRTLVELRIGGECVPALRLSPSDGHPAPAALLLHGFSSAKERMTDSIGRALLRHGVGSLALDLPLHGERRVGQETMDFRNPLALIGAWRSAVREARGAARWLAALPEVDGDGLAVMGYSLGGFLALMAAADDEALRVIALAAAGDLPDSTPYLSLVRSVVDPLRAAERLGARPLLLVNGRYDRTTRPAQAERLFAAASEPKELHWYEGGHWPPQSAIARTAAWVAEALISVHRARGVRQAG